MANQRDPKKKLVGYFATEEEKAALKKLAKERGYKSVADLLRAIANGTIKVSLLIAICFAVLHAFRAPTDWSASALKKTGKICLVFV